MSDRDGKIEPLTINTIPGKTMPRYDAHTTELTPLHATITEQAMKSNWPGVDFVFTDPHGKRYAYTTSGRMMLLLAGAIQAAVIRNRHEPDYVPVLVLALQGHHPQKATFDKAVREIADQLLARLCETHDGSELWAHTRRDPDAFREAVRVALLDVLR